MKNIKTIATHNMRSFISSAITALVLSLNQDIVTMLCYYCVSIESKSRHSNNVVLLLR